MRSVVVWLLGGLLLYAQDLVYNNGAGVYITNGAQVYVYGGWVNQNSGALLDNQGELYLRNGTGTFRGNFTNQNFATAQLGANALMTVQGDWLNDATFTAANTSRVVFDGVDNQIFNKGPNANDPNDYFGIVEINNTATGDLGVDVQPGVVMGVNNQLIFTQGIIKTAANSEVRVVNSAANAIIGHETVGANITATTRNYVAGRLRRVVTDPVATAYDFPVGDLPSGKGYHLLQLSFSATLDPLVGDPHNILASFTPVAQTPPAMNDCGASFTNALDDGYWIITGYQSDYLTTVPSLSAGKTYQPSLYNQLYTNGPGNQLTVAIDPGTGYILEGTPCTGSGPAPPATAVIRDGMTTTAGNLISVFSSNPFPVTLLSLKAIPQQNAIDVQWTTAQEINNRGFFLERSEDGTTFSTLAWIDGKGTTYTPQNYNYLDKNVRPYVLYHYRLKQIDYDGNSQYSNVVTAMITDEAQPISVQVYPNPTPNDLYLKVFTPQATTLYVQVYDVVGKQLLNKAIALEQGENTITIEDFSNFAYGTYYLKIRGEGVEMHLQVLKVRE